MYIIFGKEFLLYELIVIGVDIFFVIFFTTFAKLNEFGGYKISKVFASIGLLSLVNLTVVTGVYTTQFDTILSHNDYVYHILFAIVWSMFVPSFATVILQKKHIKNQMKKRD
jgi:hypothetical protein